MITPCVMGLWNGQVLQAMADLGIKGCVSDESVTNGSTVDYEPITPYHGVYSTQEKNGFAGMYFVPREALDIDYCSTNDAMVVDEYNTLFLSPGEAVKTFEDIMAVQKMYGIQDKVAFRQDPFMFHQANAMAFSYNDPVAGKSHNVSLISLWMERVVNELMSYFSMPIYQPQMDELIEIFQTRQTMDGCGVVTTISVSNGEITKITISGNESCKLGLSGVDLSGSTVSMETVGSELTAWIELTASQSQSFMLSTPIPL